MKKALNLCLLAMAFTCIQFYSCTKKTDTPDDTTGGGTTSTGIKMFWSNQSGKPITVKIDGGSFTGSITSYYNQSTAPSCGSSGCYSATLSTGYHSYTATDGTHTWSGSFTQTTGCNTLLLYW